MKKNLLFLIIFFTISFSSLAQQPWAQPGATWYYQYYNWYFSGYQKIEKTNDTLINSINCDKYITTVYVYDWTVGGFRTEIDSQFTYISNDTLYRWYNNQFIVMAIFNASVGDTWSIPDMGICPYQSYIQVDSTGQTIISNDTLSVLYVTVNLSASVPFQSTLIEKLGYDFTMFPYSFCVTDFVYPTPLRCYSDSSGFNYSTNIAVYCDSTVAVNEFINSKDLIEVFPSPAQDYFQINYKLKGEENYLFSLSNSIGQEVEKRILLSDANEETIDISYLPNGIYFWYVNSKDKSLSKGKLVVLK